MNSFSNADVEQVEMARVRSVLHGLGADTPLIVDFDETLWLRNSTEEYLRSLRPRLVARVLLALLDWLQPWRVLPGADPTRHYRDWVRVLTTTLLLPWSLLLWRRRARLLGPRYLNQPLARCCRAAGGRLIVATFGFRFIVAPLLRASDLRCERLVAAPLLRGFALRISGKRAALEHQLGADALADAVCITDSEQDADVLEAVARPLLIRWSQARYEDALADGYVPFLYTQRGKRTGQQYLWSVVFKRDILVLWLAFAWTQPSPIAAALALMLLHLSFWLVYEIGYHENDRVAETAEAAPALASGYAEMRERMDAPSAWLAALVLALPGVWLMGWASTEAVPSGAGLADASLDLGLLLGWVLYLVAARATFHFYNYRATAARGLLYLPLQLFRSLGYALFFAVSLSGVALCIASILISWIPYLAYRYAHCRVDMPDRLLFLIFFLLLSLAIALALPQPAGLLSAQTGAILLYLGWRARNEAMAWAASAQPLTQRALGGIDR